MYFNRNKTVDWLLRRKKTGEREREREKEITQE